MITYKQIDGSYLNAYDKIQMVVHVKSILSVEKINNGLGGIILTEIPTIEYEKDLSKYEEFTGLNNRFDLSHWAFFMAFDGAIAIAGAVVASRTKEVDMLDGRDDLAVLWDIRVDEKYKHQGIGQKLFDMAVSWSKDQGLTQMKIECQNNNVLACRFYHKQGAVLGKIDEYAYYNDSEIRNEVQLIWYLDL